MTTETAASGPIWTPRDDVLAQANLSRFMRWLHQARGLYFADYDQLWSWSVTDLEGFWSAVWQFFDVQASSGYTEVLAEDTMPGARWFPGATLNYAAHVLRPGADDDPAIVAVGEEGVLATVSRGELRRQVAALAATLRELGVRTGDRVVGYLPNIAETVVAFLAAASLGAIWSSVGQDYAPAAAVNRFAQLEPKVLIGADGYRFNGRPHDRREAVASVRAGLSTVTHTILVSRLGLDARSMGAVLPWAEATAGSARLEPVAVPFDHPLWVLFSSGTTGLPKGIVHGHGGVVLEHLKFLSLHCDLGPADRLFWYTSPSWMMWNIIVSTLMTGASVVCYDGSPTYPGPETLWRLVAEQQVTVFGTSPGYLMVCEKAGVRPAREFDLSCLRVIGSTGSPLPVRSYHWVNQEVGDLPVFSMSGGTDVVSAFVGGAPTVPVWPGELSVRCLAVAMDAWDDNGKPVREEVGELVVTRPMPSMPVMFWNDPDGSRYRDAYFTAYPGVWRHGDWITLTERGSVIVHGRSDSTLNRNGVRMGSAEIYSTVEALPGIAEALVIGVEQPDGSYWMPLFVALTPGTTLDDPFRDKIKKIIREQVSPRHVPDEIIQVPGIPHTRTGKKLEVPIKRLFQGGTLDKVANPDAVDDPALLTFFAELAARRADRFQATP